MRTTSLHGIEQGMDLRHVSTRAHLTRAERRNAEQLHAENSLKAPHFDGELAIVKRLNAKNGITAPRVYIGIAHGGIGSLAPSVLRNVSWGRS